MATKQEQRVEQLVNRTQELAREWSELFDESGGWVEAGHTSCVLIALVGALLSGPHAQEALSRLSSAAAGAAKQNLAELKREPS